MKEKIKVRRIGNSYGIILRKEILEELQIIDYVILEVKDGKVIIESYYL